MTGSYFQTRTQFCLYLLNHVFNAVSTFISARPAISHSGLIIPSIKNCGCLCSKKLRSQVPAQITYNTIFIHVHRDMNIQFSLCVCINTISKIWFKLG